MDLSIIIINWNSAEFVRHCLRSIGENTRGIDLEVIVIDNGSFDSCQAMILHEFPGVLFYQMNDNLGFARANNYGSEMASGDYLLFLNPDTETIDDAIGGMLSTIKSLPDAAALGCKLLNSDGSMQTSCVQQFPTILNQLADSDVLNRWLSLLPGGSAHSSKVGPAKVEMISGACLMIRKSIFDQVGRFDPEYFMYAEDLDLCYKAYQAGYANYYAGAYSIVHHGGGSSHKRKENSYANIQMRESMFKFLEKTRGKLYAGLYRKAMLLNGIVRFGLLSLADAATQLIGQGPRYRSSLIKWKGIIRWTLGIEKWAN